MESNQNENTETEVDLEKIVTTDGIIEWLKQRIEFKIPISPDVWVDAAQKLNVLIGDDHDRLYDLEQEVAKMKMEYMVDGDEKVNVSYAKAKVETTDQYKEARKLKAKIGRIEEQIRIAKIRARLKDNEYRQ